VLLSGVDSIFTLNSCFRQNNVKTRYRGGSRIYEMRVQMISGVKRGAVGANIEKPKASRSELPKGGENATPYDEGRRIEGGVLLPSLLWGLGEAL